MNRSIVVVLLVMLTASPVFAHCGKCPEDKGGAAHEHVGATCPMNKAGDAADTLRQAAEALKRTNPELSAKVSRIADKCCEYGLHAKS